MSCCKIGELSYALRFHPVCWNRTPAESEHMLHDVLLSCAEGKHPRECLQCSDGVCGPCKLCERIEAAAAEYERGIRRCSACGQVLSQAVNHRVLPDYEEVEVCMTCVESMQATRLQALTEQQRDQACKAEFDRLRASVPEWEPMKTSRPSKVGPPAKERKIRDWTGGLISGRSPGSFTILDPPLAEATYRRWRNAASNGVGLEELTKTKLACSRCGKPTPKLFSDDCRRLVWCEQCFDGFAEFCRKEEGLLAGDELLAELFKLKVGSLSRPVQERLLGTGDLTGPPLDPRRSR